MRISDWSSDVCSSDLGATDLQACGGKSSTGLDGEWWRRQGGGRGNSADPRRDRTATWFSASGRHLMGKFDERIEEFGLLVGAHEMARRVEDIPLERVIPDPGNPRRSFDDDALAELAASIAARGVLQPITVAPADAAGLHRIRLGERRFRASQLPGRLTIPALVEI